MSGLGFTVPLLVSLMVVAGAAGWVSWCDRRADEGEEVG